MGGNLEKLVYFNLYNAVAITSQWNFFQNATNKLADDENLHGRNLNQCETIHG